MDGYEPLDHGPPHPVANSSLFGSGWLKSRVTRKKADLFADGPDPLEFRRVAHHPGERAGVKGKCECVRRTALSLTSRHVPQTEIIMLA